MHNSIYSDISSVTGGSYSLRENFVPSTAVRLSSKRLIILECPFCAEYGISCRASRRSDLMRHFQFFHHTNKQWTCTLTHCGMKFDWRSAYEGHVKEVHKGAEPVHDNWVEICPQVVFACGFKNCKRGYETKSDVDADEKADEYFAHVVKHVEAGGSNWSYTVRLRHLMRQAQVGEEWKRRTRHLDLQLEWQVQTSATLRKMLETRHIPDISLLVDWALHLGSPLARGPGKRAGEWSDPPAGLVVPQRRTCPMAARGHVVEDISDASKPEEEGAPSGETAQQYGDTQNTKAPARDFLHFTPHDASSTSVIGRDAFSNDQELRASDDPGSSEAMDTDVW